MLNLESAKGQIRSSRGGEYGDDGSRDHVRARERSKARPEVSLQNRQKTEKFKIGFVSQNAAISPEGGGSPRCSDDNQARERFEAQPGVSLQNRKQAEKFKIGFASQKEHQQLALFSKTSCSPGQEAGDAPTTPRRGTL
jgi:hypothetical protein